MFLLLFLGNEGGCETVIFTCATHARLGIDNDIAMRNELRLQKEGGRDMHKWAKKREKKKAKRGERKNGQ